jgi:hypothetical protein
MILPSSPSYRLPGPQSSFPSLLMRLVFACLTAQSSQRELLLPLDDGRHRSMLAQSGRRSFDAGSCQDDDDGLSAEAAALAD